MFMTIIMNGCGISMGRSKPSHSGRRITRCLYLYLCSRIDCVVDVRWLGSLLYTACDLDNHSCRRNPFAAARNSWCS